MKSGGWNRRAAVLLAAAAIAWATASGRVVADRPQASGQSPAPATSDAANAPAPRAPQSTTASRASAPHAAVVQQYCVSCHSARLKTGGLVLEGLDAGSPDGNAQLWENVVRKVRGGLMPPPGVPRPDDPTRDAFVTGLERALDERATRTPDPGHKPVHRLNRSEYGNAIRDLLHLEIDVAELLPPDDESHGFDNIAGVLKVSPSLLEQYLAAARHISRLALGLDKDLSQWIVRLPPDTDQNEQVDGLPAGTRGGILIRHHFPQDGEYDFSVFLLRNIVGYMTGLEYAHQVEVSIDGQQVFSAQVGGEADNLANDTNMSDTANVIDSRLRARVPVKAGPRKVGVTFIRRNNAVSVEPLQPHRRDHDLQNMNGLPKIDYVKIQGPYNPTGAGDTPSRQRILVCQPAVAAEEAACARKILSTVARRAYRRPVADAELKPLLEMYESGRAKGSFEAGIEQALRLVLANPKFLFRTETDGTATARDVRRISDLELASRLSFFLWSSIPDDELLTVAAAGKLTQPAVLDQQVKRMLKDSRSKALVDNFAGQWLMLRNLKSHFPNGPDFPNFDDNLRRAFRTETELFFDSIMREDRSVLDLLEANYTFVNEALARHYRIPQVYGSHFRRVTLTNEARRGLLGQGSILTITSYPNRTSPVLRGKWILENILGTPPPAPPPNVPALKENDEGGEAQSLRARLEAHRRAPQCASCHRVMDPLGFALENFDGVGQWRTREPGAMIDAAGQLADGTVVDGPVSLRKALIKQPEQFVRTFSEKLLTYALGRGVEYYDMPLIRAIERDAAAQRYRFSSIVLGIVKSVPFQMKKMTQSEPATARASAAAAR